jgi:hypothetical protein
MSEGETDSPSYEDQALRSLRRARKALVSPDAADRQDIEFLLASANVYATLALTESMREARLS